jgi:hypothetical protein
MTRKEKELLKTFEGTLSRTEFQKYSKCIGSICGKEKSCFCTNRYLQLLSLSSVVLAASDSWVLTVTGA